MRVITVEEADRHISKEVVLSVSEDEFIDLKRSLHMWYQWRKARMQDITANEGSTPRFYGPQLFKRDTGEFTLRVNRWVGSISCRDLLIELKPKFPVKEALNIVCTNAIRQFGSFQAPPHQGIVSKMKDDEMGFSIAYLLITFVKNIIELGVRSSYIRKTQCAMQTRGKILISKQITKQKGLLFPVYCQVQEHSYDNLENQFIKSALQRISMMIRNRSMHSYDSSLLDTLSSKVKEYVHHFDQLGVQNVSFSPNQLPTFHFTQLNRYYQPACSICTIIFSSSSSGLADTASGTSTAIGSCWLYNMANEFETFIRDTLKQHESLALLGKGHVDWSMCKNQVHMEPDLVLDNRTLIGDVKYRKYSHAKRRSDIYQILAYTNTKIATMQDAVLVYAAVDEHFYKSVEKTSFPTCEECNSYINIHDLRKNIFLECKQCSFVVDLLCSWDFEKRIWCCCLDLPHSSHQMLIQQMDHIVQIVEKHLPW